MYPSLCVSRAALMIGGVTSPSRWNQINGKIAQDVGVKGELCGWEMFAVPLYSVMVAASCLHRLFFPIHPPSGEKQDILFP